jgi:hypothetical protein
VSDAGTEGGGHVLRRILIAFVVFIVVILVVADRVGAAVAAHVLADKLQTDEHLPHKPSTSIGGIPFLTQAVGGKYNNISVTAHDFVTDGVTVDTMNVHMHGVHLPLGKVIRGSVHTVPVDHIDGSALVTFASMENYLAKRHLPVTFTRGGSGQLEIHASGRAKGTTVSASASVALSVTNNVITLTLTGSRLPVPSVLAVPLLGLPFRVKLHSVSVVSDGVSATGTADHVVLGS